MTLLNRVGLFLRARKPAPMSPEKAYSVLRELILFYGCKAHLEALEVLKRAQ